MKSPVERTVLVNYGRNGTVVLLDRPLPWQIAGRQWTQSGYGARIPTQYKVRFAGRLRRVYCTICSNIGTCWFTVRGARMIVS